MVLHAGSRSTGCGKAAGSEPHFLAYALQTAAQGADVIASGDRIARRRTSHRGFRMRRRKRLLALRRFAAARGAGGFLRCHAAGLGWHAH
ncbi:MAG: hypothetical protein WD060_01815, partial [Pirellulales bacterium]